MRMKIKEQIKLFLKYFNSIEDNTNTKFLKSQIQSLNFNREFYNALIEDNYILPNDTTYKGYEFIIEDEENADYWGFLMKDKKDIDKTLWEVIKESKNSKEYISCEKQYQNLIKILSKLPKEKIESLQNEWMDIEFEIKKNPNYEYLHAVNGGIVYGGDDTFYMDFGGWIVAQGEELYKAFLIMGEKAILNYIEKYKVSEKEYTFECMSYVFHDLLGLEQINED